MGIMWKVGNGNKIRFLEDNWFGNSSLAIQYWPLDIINEQHGKTIAQVWDREVLKLTFRKSVSERLMLLWYKLLEVTENIAFIDDEDQIIWSYSSNGKYSVQSLYAVVNHRGVIPTYVHTVWKLHIHLEYRFFCGFYPKTDI